MANGKHKNGGTAIVKPEQETAIVVPESLRTGPIVEGDDDSAGPQISRVSLYQGTTTEQRQYPDAGLKIGDFFDALEARSLGQTIRVMRVYAWKSWAKWVQGQQAPVYSVRSKAEVPKGDLDWSVDHKPPAATECVNAIVVVVGEPWPYLFVFKRTGLRAWTRCIAPMEARREMKGTGPGIYELSSADDKNAAGQSYRRLSARFAGNPDAETFALADEIKRNLTAFLARAEAQAAAGDDDTPPEPEPQDLPI